MKTLLNLHFVLGYLLSMVPLAVCVITLLTLRYQQERARQSCAAFATAAAFCFMESRLVAYTHDRENSVALTMSALNNAALVGAFAAQCGIYQWTSNSLAKLVKIAPSILKFFMLVGSTAATAVLSAYVDKTTSLVCAALASTTFFWRVRNDTIALRAGMTLAALGWTSLQYRYFEESVLVHVGISVSILVMALLNAVSVAPNWRQVLVDSHEDVTLFIRRLLMLVRVR